MMAKAAVMCLRYVYRDCSNATLYSTVAQSPQSQRGLSNPEFFIDYGCSHSRLRPGSASRPPSSVSDSKRIAASLATARATRYSRPKENKNQWLRSATYSISPEFCLPVCLPVSLPAYLLVCLPVCLSTCLSVCLSVCVIRSSPQMTPLPSADLSP